jgi:hypothetical protein
MKDFVAITTIISAVILIGCSSYVEPDVPPYHGYQKSSRDQFYDWAFDVDGDGLADFEVVYQTTEWSYSVGRFVYDTLVKLQPLGTNAVCAPDSCLVCPISAGQIIGIFSDWSQSETVLSYAFLRTEIGWYSWWRGPWDGTKNSYLGIRIERGGDTFYGWLSLICSPITGDVEIKDVYVSDVIDRAVFAGVARDVVWPN